MNYYPPTHKPVREMNKQEQLECELYDVLEGTLVGTGIRTSWVYSTIMPVIKDMLLISGIQVKESSVGECKQCGCSVDLYNGVIGKFLMCCGCEMLSREEK